MGGGVAGGGGGVVLPPVAVPGASGVVPPPGGVVPAPVAVLGASGVVSPVGAVEGAPERGVGAAAPEVEAAGTVGFAFEPDGSGLMVSGEALPVSGLYAGPASSSLPRIPMEIAMPIPIRKKKIPAMAAMMTCLRLVGRGGALGPSTRETGAGPICHRVGEAEASPTDDPSALRGTELAGGSS